MDRPITWTVRLKGFVEGTLSGAKRRRADRNPIRRHTQSGRRRTAQPAHTKRQAQGLVVTRYVVTDSNINGVRYYTGTVIRSFSDSKTANVFNRVRVSKWSKETQRQALRKLLLIDAAENVEDLRIPPGNRLERLKGKRKGQYSVRINDQWRICFKWSSGHASDVEIVDYHKG